MAKFEWRQKLIYLSVIRLRQGISRDLQIEIDTPKDIRAVSRAEVRLLSTAAIHTDRERERAWTVKERFFRG